VRRAAIVALTLAAACSGGAPAASGGTGGPGKLPKTRAERSNYTETSYYADVMLFLDSLQFAGVPMYRTTLGITTEGRVLPLVVLSRPVVKSPAEARALHRPIVYVEANIHSNEIEGKEALQALMRDLASSPDRNVLDSIVLIAVPIYNADGNEKMGPQAVNRPEQNGPETIGEGTNGQGLNLNRDFVKAEAPETRAALAAIAAWDPDVFMDLHTTDGSFHGYALTYAPPLNPASVLGGAYARDSILTTVRVRMKQRHGYLTFDYGNFSLEYNGDVVTDTVKHGWYTYDSRPRFGTNFMGLRGRMSVLAEGYSHDPFQRRVNSMYWFVAEILSYVAEHRKSVMASSRRADSLITAWGANPSSAPPLALRATLARAPLEEDIIFEDLVRTGDSSLTQPGVPRGIRRTGHYRSQKMPVYVSFEATLSRKLPFAYAIPAADTTVVANLRLHGVKVTTIAHPLDMTVQEFVIDSVKHAERAFQGHHETSLTGKWREAQVTIPAGTFIVRTAQPMGVVAFYLLEPESDDGFVDWNFLDATLAPGETYGIRRLPASVAGLNEAP